MLIINSWKQQAHVPNATRILDYFVENSFSVFCSCLKFCFYQQLKLFIYFGFMFTLHTLADMTYLKQCYRNVMAWTLLNRTEFVSDVKLYTVCKIVYVCWWNAYHQFATAFMYYDCFIKKNCIVFIYYLNYLSTITLVWMQQKCTAKSEKF